MHVLIITAHPGSNGFTHKIAQRLKKTYEIKGHSVTVKNIYTDWRQDFLHFEESSDMKNLSELTLQIQQEITRADEICFCFPIWWYEAPAILRNFIDINFSSHFAYRFHKLGFVKGLLQPRRAKIFVTTGGPSWVYRLHIMPCAPIFRKTIAQCGLHIDTFCVFGPNHKRTPQQHEAWLVQVEESVR